MRFRNNYSRMPLYTFKHFSDEYIIYDPVIERRRIKDNEIAETPLQKERREYQETGKKTKKDAREIPHPIFENDKKENDKKSIDNAYRAYLMYSDAPNTFFSGWDASFKKGSFEMTVPHFTEESVKIYNNVVAETLPKNDSKTVHSSSDSLEKNGEYERNADRAYDIAKDLLDSETIIAVSGTLYRYNGTFYESLSIEDAEKMIFIIYHQQLNDVSNIYQIVKRATHYLRFKAQMKLDEFPENPNIVVFKNGTYDIRKKKFRVNSPDDMACLALGIRYEEDQYSMPNTDRFLQTISGEDDELYERILQMIGYILSNDLKAKSFFYLQGPRHSGKSLFCNLITSFFPKIGFNSVSNLALQDFGDKYAMGGLVNKKLNIADDLPKNTISTASVSKIKQITGSNRIEGERKYEHRFSFKPQCKLMFTSNHSLRLKEDDDAFRERVVYIPFDYIIPKEKWDTGLLEKMKQEISALFNHAIKAYQRLVKNKYFWAGFERFIPDIEIINTGISADKSETIMRFVNDCCEFDKNSTITTEDLQHDYYKYCDKNGYQPIGEKRFSREFYAIFSDRVEQARIGGKQKRGYRGVKLK